MLILILGIFLSGMGGIGYAMAYKHCNKKPLKPVFYRRGKDGFGKYNNYR